MSLLTDPGWVVPPLPPGDGGGMDRLRRAVVRFADGAEHAARRADVEHALAAISPDALRTRARHQTEAHCAGAVDRPAEAGRPAAAGPGSPVPRVTLLVLATALGVEDPAAVAALVPPVAAAYFPGSPPDEAADRAADELLARLDPATVAILVQSCRPVATLVETALRTGSVRTALESPPVPATTRWRAGETVTVPLAGMPFGEGPRRCPGEEHARALAAGVLAALRPG